MGQPLVESEDKKTQQDTDHSEKSECDKGLMNMGAAQAKQSWGLSNRWGN
jgi:hypothetical protein